MPDMKDDISIGSAIPDLERDSFVRSPCAACTGLICSLQPGVSGTGSEQSALDASCLSDGIIGFGIDNSQTGFFRLMRSMVQKDYAVEPIAFQFVRCDAVAIAIRVQRELDDLLSQSLRCHILSSLALATAC